MKIEQAQGSGNGKWTVTLTCGHIVLCDCTVDPPSKTEEVICPICEPNRTPNAAEDKE